MISNRTVYVTPTFNRKSPTKVRLFADAYIPWEWVRFPDTKVRLPPPVVAPPVGPGSLGFFFYVKGDGRGHARTSGDVGRNYRLRSMVEIDVANPEQYVWVGDNQSSLSQIRNETILGTMVLRQMEGEGPVNDKQPTVDVTSPTSIRATLKISGSVPWNVAGPQPDIFFKYVVDLEHDRDAGKVNWRISAEHDGFPAHELFIEAGGKVRHSYSYTPNWFYETNVKVAKPSEVQAVKGALALAGQHMHQRWSKKGAF